MATIRAAGAPLGPDATSEDTAQQAPDPARPHAAPPDAAPPDGALPDAALPDAALPDNPLIARLRRAARAAYTWRTIDQELDRLTVESDSHLQATARVRGPDADPFRQIAFRGSASSLEVEIGDDTLVGQIYPMHSGAITLLGTGGVIGETRADDVGCFLFDRPADSPVRLRCDVGGAALITDWIWLT